MNETIKNDLKINGSGKSSGGFYNNVIINGSGEINGNIDCINFKINGSGAVNGNIKSDKISISGSSNLKGEIESMEFIVNGSTAIGGNSNSKFVKVNGSLNNNGFLKSEELVVRGSIKINNDCNVDKFDTKGSFSIAGLLNADEINVEIYGTCTAKEIGGEKINIQLGHSFGIKKIVNAIFNLLNMKEELNTELIEGDEIYLENTKAKIVRGINIIIGDGCEIELIEYKNNFQNNGNSIIKESKQIT